MSHLNPRELEVLNILWKSDKAMTSTEIVNSGAELTQSTVQAVLRKLLKSELVEVSGVTHSGKVLSRTYRPTEFSRDMILDNFAQDYLSFNGVISVSALVNSIFRKETDVEKKRTEMQGVRALLDNLEREL